MSRLADDKHRHGSSATCFLCKRHSNEPDLDGWHVFSDGAGEQHALCADCARARARRHIARTLFAAPR